MEYTSVNNITEATHWLSMPDSNSVVKDFIIPNKAYELFKLKDTMDDQEEYFIRGEDNYLSTYWMCHKGMFVVAKENEN